jgi:hypothetical protein
VLALSIFFQSGKLLLLDVGKIKTEKSNSLYLIINQYTRTTINKIQAKLLFVITMAFRCESQLLEKSIRKKKKKQFSHYASIKKNPFRQTDKKLLGKKGNAKFGIRKKEKKKEKKKENRRKGVPNELSLGFFQLQQTDNPLVSPEMSCVLSLL